MASDVPGSRTFWLIKKLTDANVVRETPMVMRVSNPEVLYNVEVEDVILDGIRIIDKKGKKRVLAFDTLILSRRFGERRKNDALFDELQGKIAEVHKIGDCSEVKEIKDAIWGANEVARKI